MFDDICDGLVVECGTRPHSVIYIFLSVEVLGIETVVGLEDGRAQRARMDVMMDGVSTKGPLQFSGSPLFV